VIPRSELARVVEIAAKRAAAEVRMRARIDSERLLDSRELRSFIDKSGIERRDCTWLEDSTQAQ
jgi:hypothetical protein